MQATARKRACAIPAFFLLLLATGPGNAATPPPLEAYGQLPAMDTVQLSPSGTRMAFAAQGKDRRRLFVVTTDGKPLAMPAIDEVKLRGLHWAGERFVLAKTSATFNLGWEYGFRHELANYQSLDLDKSGAVTQLLGGTRTLAAAFGNYGIFERKQRWYAYLGALPLSRSPLTGDTYLGDVSRNIVEVDLETGKQKTATLGCDKCGDWLLGAGGALLASAQYDDRDGDWRLFAGKQDRQLARMKDPLGFNNILGEGRSAGTVLYQVADQKGDVRFMETALSGQGAPVEILRDENVTGLIWDPLTRLLAGFVRDNDARELVLFDERRSARLSGTRKAFPGLSVQFVSWSDDFNRFIVYTEGGGQPAAAGKPARDGDSGTYWLVDIPSGDARDIGRAYPRVPAAQVGPWRTVSYRAADGLALEGVLTLPPDRAASALPLVVLPHGGPAARDYPEFNWWAQAFASRGYAVWQPNFRGSTGYSAALRKAGNGEWGAKMQTDLSDGTAELVRQGLVDPRRVCIVGGSYGGYAALAGVTLQQGLYRCAVSVAGVTDLKDIMQYDKERRGQNARRYNLQQFGARSMFDEILAQRSPVQQAAKADAPILLIHGKDDTIVPYRQSVQMQRALQKSGKPVEFVTLEGEDHFLSRGETRTAMLKAAIAFVERHNPAGSQQAASVKAPD